MNQDPIKILVYAPQKHGKTASLRNLPPERTAIVNCDRKALPIPKMVRGYKMVRGENNQPDFTQSNYVETVKFATVEKAFKTWETRDDIDTIVWDTLSHFMAKEFFSRLNDKGFDKFNQIADATNKLLGILRRSKKNVVVFAHNEIAYDAEGSKVNKVRSFGKLLDEKIEIASMFSNVLMNIVKRGEDGAKYLFQTQSDGTNTLASPFTMDDEDNPITALEYEEPNDINLIFNKIKDFNEKYGADSN